MSFKVNISSETGNYRKQNEDFVGSVISDDGMSAIAILCDGMGGYDGGNIASRILVQRLMDSFKSAAVEEYSIEQIEKFFLINTQEAAKEMTRYADEHSLAKIGTTIAAVIITNGRVFEFYIGDSRIWWNSTYNKISWWKRRINQQSRDMNIRNYVEDQYVKKGYSDKEAITMAEEKIGTREGSVLYAAVSSDNFKIGGHNRMPHHKFREFGANTSGELHLTSDGIHDYISQTKLNRILHLRLLPVKKRHNKLIQASLDGGSKDNLSIISIRYKYDY